MTSLFEVGEGAPTVQRLAGHEDLATAERYAHVTEANLDHAFQRLAAVSG